MHDVAARAAVHSHRHHADHGHRPQTRPPIEQNVQPRMMGVTVPALAMPSISTSGLPMTMSTWLSGLVAAEMGRRSCRRRRSPGGFRSWRLLHDNAALPRRSVLAAAVLATTVLTIGSSVAAGPVHRAVAGTKGSFDKENDNEDDRCSDAGQEQRQGGQVITTPCPPPRLPARRHGKYPWQLSARQPRRSTMAHPRAGILPSSADLVNIAFGPDACSSRAATYTTPGDSTSFHARRRWGLPSGHYDAATRRALWQVWQH